MLFLTAKLKALRYRCSQGLETGFRLKESHLRYVNKIIEDHEMTRDRPGCAVQTGVPRVQAACNSSRNLCGASSRADPKASRRPWSTAHPTHAGSPKTGRPLPATSAAPYRRRCPPLRRAPRHRERLRRRWERPQLRLQPWLRLRLQLRRRERQRREPTWLRRGLWQPPWL